MMRVLVDAGADGNKQTKDAAWTALMVAAEHGGEHGAEMMRVLVDAGADGNKQTKDADRADDSRTRASTAQGGVLVDAGADANKQDVDGSTALRWPHILGASTARR